MVNKENKTAVTDRLYRHLARLEALPPIRLPERRRDTSAELGIMRSGAVRRAAFRLGALISSLPWAVIGLLAGLLNAVRSFGIRLYSGAVDTLCTFLRGGVAVRLSFLIFGLGNIFYGQVARGIFFLLFELVFIIYMLLPSGGIYWITKGNWFKTGSTVGTVGPYEGYDPELDSFVTVFGDDSVKVLLYGLLSFVFIFAFIYTWRLQIKQCRICMDITEKGKRVKSGRDDLRSLVDDEFHKTLLALPVFGILTFTVLPIVFMVLVATVLIIFQDFLMR